jgi:hypothetical protein
MIEKNLDYRQEDTAVINKDKELSYYLGNFS